MTLHSHPASDAIRVLIIDDSAVMHSLLKLVLTADPRIEVVAAASDGPAGLAMLSEVNPGLVLLDIEMPGMDDLRVLQSIRASHRTLPVIMCSTLTRRGASITLEALAAGASDYVAKPEAQNSIQEAITSLRQALIPKVLALCPPQSPEIANGPQAIAASRASCCTTIPPDEPATPKIVVIGVSTGGPAALERLLPALPADFPPHRGCPAYA